VGIWMGGRVVGLSMKWISDFGLVATLAIASSAAVAQDFSAGKTPAQLFGSDCSSCHRTPGGLAGTRDVRTLTAFLRQHYTTKPESAGALAAYVSGFAGTAAPRLGAAPGTSAPGDDARTAARPGENPARRRQTAELSGDGEKRRREDAAAPPRAAGTAAAAARPAAQDSIGQPATLPAQPVAPGAQAGTTFGHGAAMFREPLDPLVRLRAYAASGLGYEAVAAEAARVRPAEARHSERAPAATGEGDPARADADALAVIATPAPVPQGPSGAAAAGSLATQVRPPLPR
jgi:hypothetical protein